MSDDWDKLADHFAKHKYALIAKVDCTSDEGQPICDDFDVQVCGYVVGVGVGRCGCGCVVKNVLFCFVLCVDTLSFLTFIVT
jgi:hypothetical protein